jgi:hypothetical protein
MVSDAPAPFAPDQKPKKKKPAGGNNTLNGHLSHWTEQLQRICGVDLMFWER